MKQSVGRPYNPMALKRIGKRFDFLLSIEDERKLSFLSKVYKTPRSEVLRKLLRDLFLKESEQ